MRVRLSDFRTKVRPTVRRALQAAKADGVDRWVCWDWDDNLCYTDHADSAEDMCCIATCHPNGVIEQGFVF